MIEGLGRMGFTYVKPLIVDIKEKCFLLYSSPSLSVGHAFQDPQWMPGIVNSTKPYRYCVFSYTYISVIKFTL